MAPWRVALSAMVLTGLGCCALPLSDSLRELMVPHFGIGLGVGAVDAAMVPFLASLVDRHQNLRYGPTYALQQLSVNLAYFFGPLVGGSVVRSVGFPWLIRIVGLLNVVACPLLTELESVSTKGKGEGELSSEKMYFRRRAAAAGMGRANSIKELKFQVT